jgi:hypothetical protein
MASEAKLIGARRVRAVVSKRGVDDGNQKGGGFLQPAQESQFHYSMKKANVKTSLKIFFALNFPCYLGKIGSTLSGGKDMEEKKIDIKIDEHVALGQYSNLAAIRHTREEFIFDFAFIFPDGPMGKLVSRTILSPAHAKRFLQALEANIKKYEENFGPIIPAEVPPAVGFVH